ncbi:uncharacterized protein LOC135820507 [Sycon ciliatum]|uniref:uncharacterized protein LOC135820507 n=1 Tax=Sycon ciliatum TaxID=27933 RepID=UPI0031F64DE0
MAEEFNCRSYPLVGCDNCSAMVPSCDMDDHLQNICRHVKVPCCNRAQGCTVLVKRHRMSAHLEACPVSAVVCAKCIDKFSEGDRSERSRFGADYRCVFRRDEILRHYQDVHDTMEARDAQRCECPWKDSDDCHRCEDRLVPFNRDWTVHTFPDGVEVVAPVSSVQAADAGEKGTDEQTDERTETPEVEERRPPLHRGLSKEDELSFYGYESHEIVGDSAERGVRVPRQLSQAAELAMYGYDCEESTLSTDSYLSGVDSPLLDIPEEVLDMILAKLDVYSLRQVSLTCNYLRDICWELVKKRGVMQLKWEKSGDGWVQKGEIWHFSTFTTYVGKENWVTVPDFLRMADHSSKHSESRRADLVAKEKEQVWAHIHP